MLRLRLTVFTFQSHCQHLNAKKNTAARCDVWHISYMSVSRHFICLYTDWKHLIEVCVWVLATALESSGLLDRLLALAKSKISAFGPLEVTLALDGLARLKLQPGTPLLDALAEQVLGHLQQSQISGSLLAWRQLTLDG